MSDSTSHGLPTVERHGEKFPWRPPSYLSRASLATELDCAESTVDEMVKRGVLPAPLRLSTGCVRWRWADVETALASLKNVRASDGTESSDPYIRGIANVPHIKEGRLESA
jgi:predicted DNA-binding transcriptional regulator AlpA